MSQHPTLSQRGKAAATNAMRIDLELYYQALENPYHPQENPSGSIPMNMAENHLGWELLKAKMEQISAEQTIPDWVASYGDPAGVFSFRESVCNYFNHFLQPEKGLDAARLACSAGATGVIEMTSFLLANSGDTAVIPAPSYPVYTADLQVFSGIQRFDLTDDLSIAALATAKSTIEASGSQFKLLILTQPDNPSGKIYSPETLGMLSDWCISNRIHLIVNEIYALSLLDITHPAIQEDYQDTSQFQTFLSIIEHKKSPYLHFWYSFSKDLGISGFRIGTLYSHNEELIQGYRNVGLSHCISNHTQWLLQEVLKDVDFMEKFIAHGQEALTENYIAIVMSLKKLRIPYTPSRGSLFVWLNLSEFLSENSTSGEEKLWLDIFHETGILLTPTNGFGHTEKGWYRMVISSQTHLSIKEAMKRLAAFVESKRINI
jgi:aspartate/methionine/tyrosine aminotransferase